MDGGRLAAYIKSRMGQRLPRRRPGGPRLVEAARLALFYWEAYRMVEWSGRELRWRGAGGGTRRED